MQAAQQLSCVSEQNQAVKDFQAVYDAFAKAIQRMASLILFCFVDRV